MLFLNSTSGSVASFWGAYAQELMLREFMRDTAGDKKVKLEMTLAPFP